MLRFKTESVKNKLTVIIDTLSIVTHRNKPADERRAICVEALKQVSLDTLTTVQRSDNDLVRGVVAIEAITKNVIDTNSLADYAKRTLKTIMPLWAYSHGSDHFDQIPNELVAEIAKLYDTSWHNNALPSFDFGNFETPNGEHAISAWIGFDGESYEEDEFVFALNVSKDGEFIHTLDSEDFLDQFKLPLETNFGARGNLSNEDAAMIIKFLQEFGTKECHPQLLSFIKEECPEIF